MRNRKMRSVTSQDIPAWMALSREYDVYVSALVSDLGIWYKGDADHIAFADYMKGKIRQKEAFMVVDAETGTCLGVVAFSKKHNRVTFFGVSHAADFSAVGNMLMACALSGLDSTGEMTATVLKSEAPHILKQKELFAQYGFKALGSALENGVPVCRMSKWRQFSHT